MITLHTLYFLVEQLKNQDSYTKMKCHDPWFLIVVPTLIRFSAAVPTSGSRSRGSNTIIASSRESQRYSRHVGSRGSTSTDSSAVSSRHRRHCSSTRRSHRRVVEVEEVVVVVVVVVLFVVAVVVVATVGAVVAAAAMVIAVVSSCDGSSSKYCSLRGDHTEQGPGIGRRSIVQPRKYEELRGHFGTHWGNQQKDWPLFARFSPFLLPLTSHLDTRHLFIQDFTSVEQCPPLRHMNRRCCRQCYAIKQSVLAT